MQSEPRALAPPMRVLSTDASRPDKPVDIISLLSKATEQYRTNQPTDSESEPKPMSGRKSTDSDLIKPTPIRISNGSQSKGEIKATTPTGDKTEESIKSFSVQQLFDSIRMHQHAKVPNLPEPSVKPKSRSGSGEERNPSGDQLAGTTAEMLERDLREKLQISVGVSPTPVDKQPVTTSLIITPSYLSTSAPASFPQKITGVLPAVTRPPVLPIMVTPEMIAQGISPLSTPSKLSSSVLSPTSVDLPLSPAVAIGPVGFGGSTPSLSRTLSLGSGAGDVKPRINPLTKEQLVQSLQYMLKNDSEFVTKLHEAYVKSLLEATSSHRT